MKDGIRKLWRALFPPKGEFLCIVCCETFPLEERKTRTATISAEVAEMLEEPEAEGQTDELEFCPRCFEKTRVDYND